ncbi:MAG TPA: amidase family protein [Caulobacteraceae bacterium]|jgi:amidase
MSFAEYASYDGVGLAALVRKGEVSPADLVEAAIERIERNNEKLNAVVFKAYDEARAAAKSALPDGPFKGVPFLIKDLGQPVAGWPRTGGSRFMRDVVDDADGSLVSLYRASGAILLGKTNTPEFGITGTTESAYLGPCRTPWNPDHISGGSSGGSAAATAAGMVPLAHASDGLGSIRIPAACCGLFGLKITRDRNPIMPDTNAYGNTVEHVVSRTVRDSAVMLDHTGVPVPGAPYPEPPKARPYGDEVGASPGRLKIAFSAETPREREIDPEVRDALLATADLLRRLGHDVEERGLGIDYLSFYRETGRAGSAAFAADVDRWIERIGREPQEDEFEPLTWASLNAGRRVTGAQAMQSMIDRRLWGRRINAFFETCDVYLTPVMGMPPPPIGWIDTVALEPREVNRRQAQAFPYTPPFNVSGQPSMSVPLAMSSAGLPIGMMFTGRYADEATLFRLAGQLEKEAPWKDRRPAVWD